MIHKSSFLKHYLILLLTTLSLQVFAQANIDEGKSLFKANCATCHNKNMKDDLTGPALGGIRERWEGREELLVSWIRNSANVIASGDEYAVSLYNKWNKTAMNAFPNFTDEQIESILLYVDCMNEGTCGGPIVAQTGDDDLVITDKEDNNFLYIVLFLILGILALALTRIVSNLNYLAEVSEGARPTGRKTMMDTLTSKGVVGFIIFSLVVLGGYTTVNNAINLGRQQGYAPDQPIKFSHALHAGTQKIDCQYCHDGARRSKHSVIPAANTCMNCHKAIEKGSTYGTQELTKIFASIGYDPSTDKYLANYDDMKDEDVKAVYIKWIKENFEKDKEADYADKEAMLSTDAEAEAEKQWAHIVESLTNETKTKVQGPIEWTRIHNLPDHVYFNHAQHVSVGKVECQTCHGPVEKMEVLQQYAPLSMGWCINCHRQTEVQFAGNEYYEQYEVYHKEIKAGKRERVTVEDIGGLECQKCHY